MANAFNSLPGVHDAFVFRASSMQKDRFVGDSRRENRETCHSQQHPRLAPSQHQGQCQSAGACQGRFRCGEQRLLRVIPDRSEDHGRGATRRYKRPGAHGLGCRPKRSANYEKYERNQMAGVTVYTQHRDAPILLVCHERYRHK